MLRSIVALVSVSVLFACGPQTAELNDDEFGEATSELTIAPASAAQILAAVNYPGTDLTALDAKGGLDLRAAKNIIAYRNGADGLCPSGDDKFFKTIGELDALPFVADSAFQKLLVYAQANPTPNAEVVEGVSFEGWQSEIVLWGVNSVSVGVLNGLLDNRAAANLIANRPFTSVTQAGLTALVGPSALEALRGQARTWWSARNSTPSFAGTFDGVIFDEATAVKALELANTATAAELTARGVYSTGATAIVASRPLADLAAVAALSGVGASSMQALQKWASTPATPVLTLAQVQANLATAAAGIWMPSETDAVLLLVTGEQLNGAAITPSVIRSHLTVQHDALISSVMYTDPSERSLAAKTLVEERSALGEIQRIIDNTDPADDVYVANSEKFKVLKTVLETQLTDVKMVRFGRISISVFIVGRAPSGELVGLLTGVVET